MLKTAFTANKIHGLLFDGAVFLANITLAGRLPRIGDEVADATAGSLLLLAVLTQSAGAWWKKGYLRQRLAQQRPTTPKSIASRFMTLLLFFHFLLFSLITLLALALLGIYQPNGVRSFLRGDIWIIIAFLAGVLITNLVRTAGQPKEPDIEAATGPGWLEFGADGLLWLSVILVTRIFWDGLLLLAEPAAGSGLSGQSLVLLAALSFLFVFFYLPGRYLFLVEDYQSGLTWVQVWIAMLPVVWLVVAG